MPITANGFLAKKFSDVLSEVNIQLREKLASDINTSPESILGIITNIVSEMVSDQEDLIQIVSDNGNVDKAEGKYLEDLVALIRLTRLGASPSSGTLEVTGGEGTEITVDNIFYDLNKNEMKPTEGMLLTRNNCSQVTISLLGVGSAPTNTVYSVTLNNLQIPILKTDGETSLELTTRLAEQISRSAFSITASVQGGNIVIRQQTEGYTLEADFSENVSQISVTGYVPVKLVESGPITVLAGEVTSGDVSGVISINNLRDFSTGRYTESDEELRARQQLSPSIVGNTTEPAIRAKLLQVSGVSSVTIVVNSKAVDDPVTGLPANSFECVVTGGSDSDVGEAIFDSKPISIETVGNTRFVDSYLDNPYPINFTRPDPSYLWVRAEYTPEGLIEDLGTNTDEAVEQAILDYAATLSTGDSFIPKKSFGYIYNATTGIGEIFVSVGVSDDPQVEPTYFSDSAVSVSNKQYLELVANRINILPSDIIIGDA